MGLRLAAILKIFQFDVVTRIRLQRDGVRPFRATLALPFINQQLVVHPQFQAVIGDRVKDVGLGILRFDLPRPANRVKPVAEVRRYAVRPDWLWSRIMSVLADVRGRCRGPRSFSDSTTSYLRSHPSLGIICA